MVKINVYPSDQGGCGYYRIRWAAAALAAQGADVDIIGDEHPPERQIQATWYGNETERRLVDVRAPEADVIVLQRPLTDTLAGAVAKLQDQGIRVVVEIDDDFEAISARNISWRVLHPRTSPRRNWLHLRYACVQADWVVVSTPALAARYGAHGRVSVVPNCVPAAYLEQRPEPHDGVIVGWSGSIGTHPDDLQVVGGAVAKVLRATGSEMAVVGTGIGIQRRLGLSSAPRASGWMALDAYPEALAQLDVGIVPLELTPFNEAKSALKMMEMAAVGVACVGSPTGENRRMHTEGIGLMAGRPRDWERHLKLLCGSSGARAELAGRGREVMRRWTIEGNAGRWWEAWSAPVNASCAV